MRISDWSSDVCSSDLRQTGRRVLAGAIARGETASIRAAVWYSDIKDFTVLSDLLPRQELIDLLNGDYEASVPAVEERGGEIVKLLGDGLLARFPLAPDAEDPNAGDRDAGDGDGDDVRGGGPGDRQ